MSQSQLSRIERLEAGRTDVTTELTVRRADDPAALFTVIIPYMEPAVVTLAWPERGPAYGDSVQLSEHESEGETDVE